MLLFFNNHASYIPVSFDHDKVNGPISVGPGGTEHCCD